MTKVNASHSSLTLLFLGAWCTFATPGICGELRDTLLPSEKQAIQQPQIQQHGRMESQAVRATVPDSVYDNFRKDTKSLKDEDKGHLEKFFQKQLDQAKQEGRADLIEYDTKILQILKEK